jgi:hypothetical protein
VDSSQEEDKVKSEILLSKAALAIIHPSADLKSRILELTLSRTKKP